MKRSLVLASLLCGLVACAPAATVAPPDRDGAALRLASIEGGVTAYFNAGLSDVFPLKFTITGSDLRVNAPQYCNVSNAAILCTVPRLPAGGNFVLPMRGSNISVVALYKRASGAEFKLTAQQ
ncbi:hypothetical protein [Deinococcus humi]|uniref:Uncharacterized protein n=1 Tax=Deinococcus humi TaxID=662880 RepID=A0A7W8NE90_9DEIO|nr:hypothetical protein [Deinococcus humi]MBB5363106.1 hypothetical protein [Deinococcus humi]GGO24671.1 hypothetical protein GCM10008949_13800 [Deinococcus humi]